jgi:phosphate transport system substrate-binding protein
MNLIDRRTLLATMPFFSLINSSSAQNVPITGAGATFPRPLYERWAQMARNEIGIQLNYQSIGSGGGINQISARTVDFGASDAPLSTEQLNERNLLQFPTVMGSVVLSFNLPGLTTNTLKLSPSVIADLFLGKITRWRDPRIAQDNPDIRFPNIPISVAYRADGSGTTWIFTNYLSRISNEWKDRIGSGTSVRWITGNGARGNEGVSNIIRNTPGSIGYIENAYAVVNRMPVSQIKNRDGVFVSANSESFNATASAANWNVPNFATDTINLSGQNIWPITSPTYILIPRNPIQERVEATRNSLRFFDWSFKNGGEVAERLLYIPLPNSVHEMIRQEWRNQIVDVSGNPIF